MAFEIYSTVELMEVQRFQPADTGYWLAMYPREKQFKTQDIAFDEVAPDRRLAPFVAPNVQGRIIRRRGYNTKTFRPAYTKPKHHVTPQDAVTRMAGEPYLGEWSLEQRYDAIVAENMATEKAMIRRLWDWMACRATVDGQVTIVGDDYPEVTVDFGRDSSLEYVLSGNFRWWTGSAVGSTANPLGDIEAGRRNAFQLSQSPITRLTFGLDAWAYFIKYPEVQRLLDNNYRNGGSNFNERTPVEGQPYEYRGRLSGEGVGSLELYTYSDQYEVGSTTPATLVDFIPTNIVVGTGPGMRGTRAFGAIMDKRAQLQAMSMFPKMWDQEDPPGTYTMTQSAPLMIPVVPNNTFKITVGPAS